MKVSADEGVPAQQDRTLFHILLKKQLIGKYIRQTSYKDEKMGIHLFY